MEKQTMTVKEMMVVRQMIDDFDKEIQVDRNRIAQKTRKVRKLREMLERNEKMMYARVNKMLTP
jgi:hypothetical protein